MLHSQMKLLFVCTFLSFCYGCSSNFTTIKFDEGLKKLFGENNVLIQGNGSSIQLSLDNRTGGSGFVSRNPYKNGLFSASIKLPSPNYTAGIVVAFYLSNSGKHHDEIDFEFLGHAEGQEWTLQTNFYGNGSTSRGREERYKLWFNPSEAPHRYTIYWSETRVIIYVDGVLIREVPNLDGLGGDYPSKPMSLYATIWDGSSWATNGGQQKINHEYGPFVVEFTDLVIYGCSIDPIQDVSSCNGSDYVEAFGEVTPMDLREYEVFRKQYVTYSYCHDKERYSTPLPECLVSPIGGRPN